MPTVISIEEIEQFAEMSDGKYLSDPDMEEIASLYNTWPPYEIKSTVQAA